MSGGADSYRRAIESEGGEPISAGARAVHVRRGVDPARTLHIDLSAVPEENRPALIEMIENLVSRASRRDPGAEVPAENAG